MRIAGSVAACALGSQSALQSCKVYVSEGRDASIISRLQEAASLPHVRVADIFCDKPYHRTNFVLVSSSESQLVKAAVALSKTAIQCVDMRVHQASHPRLGSIDHVSCQPVGNGATLAAAAAIASAIGATLGDSVPVYMYGAAHPAGQSLAAIRRAMGYFRCSPSGFWAGTSACSSNAVAGSDNDTRQAGIQQTDPPPDHGQLRRSLRCGAAAVGASQWVTNLNVPLATDDLKAARLIARSVGHRGGGLPFVEAMALPHANGIEIACNLLSTADSSEEAVMALIATLARQNGLSMGTSSYVLGPTRQQLLEAHHF